MTRLQNGVAGLLALGLLAGAAPQSASFSGLWIESQPKKGPPMRLNLTQAGSQVEVRLSYRDSFSDRVFGVGSIENGQVTWASPQSCAAQFRSPGYNYDNPGVNTFTLSLAQPADGAQPGPLLIYSQETQWDVPCGGHPIGPNRIQRVLARR